MAPLVLGMNAQHQMIAERLSAVGCSQCTQQSTPPSTSCSQPCTAFLLSERA